MKWETGPAGWLVAEGTCHGTPQSSIWLSLVGLCATRTLAWLNAVKLSVRSGSLVLAKWLPDSAFVAGTTASTGDRCCSGPSEQTCRVGAEGGQSLSCNGSVFARGTRCECAHVLMPRALALAPLSLSPHPFSWNECFHGATVRGGGLTLAEPEGQ